MEQLRKDRDNRRAVECTVINRSRKNDGWVVKYKDVIGWGFLPDYNLQPGVDIKEGDILPLFVVKISGKFINSYIEFTTSKPRRLHRWEIHAKQLEQIDQTSNIIEKFY